MTIFRTFDPSLHNRIANDPAVRPMIGGHLGPDGIVDFADCAARADHYILLSNGVDATAVFEIMRPAVLDGHSMFAPTCRGRRAVETGRAMIRWLFKHTAAQIITGATPIELKAARWFNRQIGAVSDGTHLIENHYWRHDHEHFHILKSEWMPTGEGRQQNK